MLIYLLKSGLCLLVLFGFYKLFMENEHFHGIKRIYLLGALIFSFCLPLITFTYEVEMLEPVSNKGFREVNFTSQNSDSATYNWVQNLSYLALLIYAAGVIFFGFRFFKNLRSLLKEARENEKLRELNYIFILLGQKLDPHSFFNYIFLNKREFEDDKISKAVIEHEKAHVDQKHSLDLLFIEILQVVFWFNPMFHWIKRSVKLNHEFLADKKVLSKNFNALEYSNILFNYTSGYHHNSLSSPINHSLIKKRIIMITKDFSIKKLLSRIGLFVPVLGCCIFLFNNDIVAKPVINTTKATLPNKTFELPAYEEHPSLSPVEEEKPQSVFQEPDLKIKIEGNKVWVNGKATEVKDFANALDAITKNWSDEDLENASLNIKTSNSEEVFIKDLEEEFAKTRFSKVTGRSILPPPPPVPPLPNPVAGQVPPPPPAPLHERRAERIDMERKHREMALAEREHVLAEREKMMELRNELQNDKDLSVEERKRVMRNIERKQEELHRKAERMEMKHREMEGRHVQMEREQMRMERMEHDIPAPPPPPNPEHVIDEVKAQGGSFFYNDNKISAGEAKDLVRNKENIQINVQSSKGENARFEIRDN